MDRVIGTITLNFEDTGSVARDLHAVKNAALNMRASGFVAENPAGKTWNSEIPELTDWSAELNMNLVKTSEEIPHISQSEIETLAIAGTKFPVTFTAPNGAEYDGTGYVSDYTLPSQDQAVNEATVFIQGATALTIANPTT